MKSKVVFFSGFAVSLFLAHHFGADHPLPYLSWASLACLFIFYFFLQEETFFPAVCLVLFIASVAGKSISSGDYFLLHLLPVMGAMIALGVVYREDWKKNVSVSASARQAAAQDLRALELKSSDRESNVRDIVRQVSEITTLYELAKEFNDCLSYEAVIEALRKRVFVGLSFKKAILLVFAAEGDLPSVVRKFTIHEGGGVEDSDAKADLTAFEKKIILTAYEKKEVFTVRAREEADPSWLQNEQILFPLLIFPLVVQGKTIAVFVLQGTVEEDRPKFEVVAAELALHVKKIKLYETVRELSIVDGLTQVFVRRHFIERFEEELRRSMRHGFQLVVLMLDIDHFKSYNDNHGHLVGDVTLREVAQVILANVRRVDIVARYGGEEFAIVLPESDKKDGMEVAERIRSAVAKKRLKLYDEQTKVTVSIGVSAFPADIESGSAENYKSDLILELLRKADQALYQAKEDGRNRVVAFGRMPD